MKRTHYGFIGLGLIGGSIARCIRNACPDADILAYNYYKTKKNPRLEHALSDGVLSEITTELSDFSRCEVIFLCATVKLNINYLQEIIPFLQKGCILTDVGSVKGDIYQAAIDHQLSHCFIGGHPMAGTEKIGYDYSFADLLKNCYYILTPCPAVSEEDLSWMKHFVTDIIHANCVSMDVHDHDQATSGISHTPHVISAALVNTVKNSDTKGYYKLLAAGGFKDITRISSSSPDMWQTICLENKSCILDFLDQYEAILKDIRASIEQEDAEAIRDFFQSAKQYRDQLLQ